MKKKKTKRVWMIAGLTVLSLVVVACVLAQGVRVTIEMPEFAADPASTDGLEIRHYGPRIVAQTWVEAPTRRAATREGFSRLAGYIFGGNKSRASQQADKIAMTAPVEIEPEPQKIAMTAPVESEPDEQGRWKVVFTMPSQWTMETLPVPNDKRVEIVEAPARTVAVVRFSGTLAPEDVDPQRQKLRRLVKEQGYRMTGPITVAGYDPPSVLPALRRNEVMVPVESDK